MQHTTYTLLSYIVILQAVSLFITYERSDYLYIKPNTSCLVPYEQLLTPYEQLTSCYQLLSIAY